VFLMFKSLLLLYKAGWEKEKICQLVVSLLTLSICVLSVHSFLEPFWVKNLCDPGTWHPKQGPRQKLKVKKSPVVCVHYVLVSVWGYGATSREMGQQESKEWTLFIEILCSRLPGQGCKVSKSQLERFLSYVQKCTQN
jgi:hypothetical protein